MQEATSFLTFLEFSLSTGWNKLFRLVPNKMRNTINSHVSQLEGMSQQNTKVKLFPKPVNHFLLPPKLKPVMALTLGEDWPTSSAEIKLSTLGLCLPPAASVFLRSELISVDCVGVTQCPSPGHHLCPLPGQILANSLFWKDKPQHRSGPCLDLVLCRLISVIFFAFQLRVSEKFDGGEGLAALSPKMCYLPQRNCAGVFMLKRLTFVQNACDVEQRSFLLGNQKLRKGNFFCSENFQNSNLGSEMAFAGFSRFFCLMVPFTDATSEWKQLLQRHHPPLTFMHSHCMFWLFVFCENISEILWSKESFNGGVLLLVGLCLHSGLLWFNVRTLLCCGMSCQSEHNPTVCTSVCCHFIISQPRSQGSVV